jgi:phthiocerol/phenolphthiocerol synthesis type-I polyketide synthase D
MPRYLRLRAANLTSLTPSGLAISQYCRAHAVFWSCGYEITKVSGASDSICYVPFERWDSDVGGLVPRFGGFVSEPSMFDAACFGMSSSEACCMDTQQKMLLMVALEALATGSSTQTGAFVGISSMEHPQLLRAQRIGLNVFTATGGALSVAAGWLSFSFGLKGPALSVDTACSSSLVGLHLARAAVTTAECTDVVAAGVNALLLRGDYAHVPHCWHACSRRAL